MNATTNSTPPFPAARYWAAAVGLWCCAAVGVWGWITHYACSAAPISISQNVTWPDNSSLTFAVERPTLVLFIHPRCPCTVASVHELQHLLTGAGLQEHQLPTVLVVATLPSEISTIDSSKAESSQWMNTDSLAVSATLPNVEIHWDVGGIEATRFDARTSGTVMLFDTNGTQRFSGGVTIARGHQGSSVGGDSLRQLLSESTPTSLRSTPVFGCSLITSPTSARSMTSPVVNKLDAYYENHEGVEQ